MGHQLTQKAIETGVYQGWFLTMGLALIMQFTGQWILMILAGAIGSITVKRLRHAFLTGFLGVATAWSGIFLFLVQFAQAYEIGEFFATLIGLPGFGRFIVSISILIGGLLGASGALVGRSLVEFIEEFMPKNALSESDEQ